MQKTLYIGLDTHKASISVTAAEEGRDASVRFLGPISNNPTDIAKLAKRLSKDGHRLEFCYEAGCCGYVIYRQLVDLGHACMVVAPSKIPTSPGDRIKTDRRDSQRLAMLHRAGELTRVWVPDEIHEAIRELVRACAHGRGQTIDVRQTAASRFPASSWPDLSAGTQALDKNPSSLACSPELCSACASDCFSGLYGSCSHCHRAQEAVDRTDYSDRFRLVYEAARRGSAWAARYGPYLRCYFCCCGR